MIRLATINDAEQIYTLNDEFNGSGDTNGLLAKFLHAISLIQKSHPHSQSPSPFHEYYSSYQPNPSDFSS